MDIDTLPVFTQHPRMRLWQASWIWTDDSNHEANSYRLARRAFALAATPASAELLIAAGSQYRLWVNGELVGDGAPLSAGSHTYFDRHDLAELLQTGDNCIAVQLRTLGDHFQAAHGGLLCELLIDGAVHQASDADWRMYDPGAWAANTRLCHMNKTAPFQEHCDGRRLPTDWQQSGFDDSAWPQARVLGRPPLCKPWTMLVERDIPPLERDTLQPRELVLADEAVDLCFRHDRSDVAHSLSQNGRPLSITRADNWEALLSGDDGCRLRCSDEHLKDHSFDGRWDPCLLMDFGEELTAWIDIELSAPAGARLEIGSAERLIDGHFSCTLECHFADQYTCRDGRQVFRTMAWRAFRYLKLRLKNCSEADCQLHAVRAVRCRSPFADRGGISGDEELEGIFRISKNTIRLCAVDALMDTPWREAAQWLGDVAAVTLGGIYAISGDQSLPAKFLRQAAGNMSPEGILSNLSNCDYSGSGIPDYSLWYIHGLWNHYLYSGETSWVHSLYPECRRIMRFFCRHLDDDGLLTDVPGWIFIDWAPVDKDGSCAALNAIFVGQLEVLAQMAELIGDTQTASSSRELAAHMRAAFAKRFLSGDGLVHDAWRDGQLSQKISEQGNFAAIRFGCVSDAQAKRIVDRFLVARDIGRATVDFTEAQPFFMVVVLEALAGMDRVDLAVELIRERWGQRFLAKGYDSCLEEWYHNGSWRNGDWLGFMRTHSHAWSACPAEFLTKHLIGLEIAEPGCSQIRVAPHTAFDYEVTYPLPQGDLVVTVSKGQATSAPPAGVTLQN